MPVVFFCAGRALLAHRLISWWVVVTAFAVATQFAAGHPQVTLYSAMAVWGFLVVWAAHLREKLPHGCLRALARSALGFLAGLLLIAPQVVPTLELVLHSYRIGERTFGDFAGNSIHPLSLFELLIPLFHGGAVPIPFWAHYWHVPEM
jgi:hypothetical protein